MENIGEEDKIIYRKVVAIKKRIYRERNNELVECDVCKRQYRKHDSRHFKSKKHLASVMQN